MAARRFKVNRIEAGRAHLTGPEAHHAVSVLRLGIGDSVIVFDGRGAEADGRIIEISPSEVVVEVGEARQPLCSPGSLTLAVATPKGERADWMVEKCTELGGTRLIPLRTQRGSVSPGAGKLARWRRKANEAAKQSGQARVMIIEQESPLEEPGHRPAFLPPSLAGGAVFFGAQGAEQTLTDALRSLDRACDVTIFVGPEGGFTEEEIAALKDAGGQGVTLAGPILRIETAAIAAASVWAQWQIRRFDGPPDLS